MIVISDTSPLNYLVLIELEHILPALFGEIVLPTAVFEEMRSARAPEKLRAWLAALPSWIRIEAAPAIDPELMNLDAGEREVIALGLHVHATFEAEARPASSRQDSTERDYAPPRHPRSAHEPSFRKAARSRACRWSRRR